MPTVAYITNASAATGVGLYAEALRHSLPSKLPPAWTLTQLHLDGQQGVLMHNDVAVHNLKPWPYLSRVKTINWVRLARTLRQTLRHLPPDFLMHATNQTLSFVTRQHQPAIITVHDLIEWVSPQSWAGGLSSHYLYQGIAQAKHLIAVSAYTAGQLQAKLNIPPERITVIPNGVSPDIHPLPEFAASPAGQRLRQELNLGSARVILFVGSDHPRKNVSTALQAFARVHRTLPNTLFLKVGEPGLTQGRTELLNTMRRAHLTDHVRLINHVSRQRLNELYNLADVFVFPSTAEGFGLPPLEAMAAGVPVVASNATAIPEVIGSAGCLREPFDVDGFAHDILALVQDSVYTEQRREQGRQRAAQFSWDRAAQATAAVYQDVLSQAQ